MNIITGYKIKNVIKCNYQKFFDNVNLINLI